jgi:hypothetical protein
MAVSYHDRTCNTHWDREARGEACIEGGGGVETQPALAYPAHAEHRPHLQHTETARGEGVQRRS